MNLLDELRWRGMIHNETGLIPGTGDFLSVSPTRGYIGYDPTGESLHIGNLATIMLLVHLQRVGHTPIALVGGATGMVGDPSGKDAERQLLDLDQLKHNETCIRRQLEHFLDFESPVNPAEVVNNYDWMKKMGFLDFLRDIGKHLTINYMMAKDSVKKRIEGGGISYTEFAYQLIQGYDFLYLYQHKGVRLQMGGSDQWGNITTGTELIRRKLGHKARAYALTCPLITREDGSKFGKTADGHSVWLSPEKTSPYLFYQYWLNVSDTDAEKYIKVFTLMEQEEIAGLREEHQQAHHLRVVQKALAADVTRRVHGQGGLDRALAQTKFFFARKYQPEDLAGMPLDMWDEIADSSQELKTLSRDTLLQGINVVDLLASLAITASKGEARRSIEKDRSIQINARSCTDISHSLDITEAIHDRYLLVQRGKKNKYIIRIQ